MYRKFSAGNIFTGQEMLGNNKVLVTDESGKIIDIVAKEETGGDAECFDGILCPGFVNAHCHLELSHMQGHIPEHTGLVDFVFKIISERHFTEEEILAAIEKADNEMHESGIVAVGDICNNALTIPQKQKSKIHYHNFIEASGFPPSVAAPRFQRSLDFFNEYKKVFPSNSIVPHAPYSVSTELFSMIASFPNNKVLTIHNQETAAENDFFEKGEGGFLRLFENLGIDISFFRPSGKTSLQTYLPYLKNQESLILVHNVHTSENDIAFEKNHTSASLHQPFVFYCLCPNANLYIANTLPDVNLFIKENCNIVLGTDSLASNNQLSILEEMKTLQKHFPSLSTTTLLGWATINGAKALQMQNKLGSFEKGKKPGIILIEGLENSSLTTNTTSKRIL